jgi:YVTN family beta-propeller protein
VSIIGVAGRTVIATIATGKRPFGVTIDAEGRSAYTANVASNDVTVIDIAAQRVLHTIKVGNRPYAVALAAGRGFVTDQYAGTVTVFEVATGGVERSFEACDHPEGIEADAARAFVYVACWGDNNVLKIDAKTLQIIAKASVGDGPRAFGKFLR